MKHDLNISVDLALYLRTKRKVKELTQDQLANKAGYHTTTIGRWERGEQFPRMDELENILEVLGAELVIREKG